MERAVRDEVDMEEDLSKLYERCMDNLLKWLVATAEVTASLHEINKRFLDAALEEARNPMTTSTPIYLEGCHESVYNARWHHVVEVPDGEGTGMEVEEGKPPQSWTYKKFGYTLEKDDCAQQSGAPRLRLMVLTSDKGWPYSWKWKVREFIPDCYVNCEVERVWQIAKGGLTAWFSSHGRTDFKPERRLLVGTPGIGKSMAAGSYLLYQLLHCDVEKIQVVVHCFGGGDAYVSDKTTRAVTKCSDEDMYVSELRSLRGHGRNAYIIYDVAKEGTPPPRHFAPTSGWGMIAVSSPKVTNYDEWAKQLQAARVIVNCPDEVDVKAMCAWMKRDETKEKQAECWKEVKKHMYLLGPIPRHVFDEEAFRERCGAVESALLSINEGTVKEHFSRGGESPWYSEDPSHKLVKVVR
ncbi:retrotransposon hot spot (RHS) protein [Trypanosoma cruzi Dm28c]|uniref:Retrotransposon hot spot (RHS) protein n=2 Tax=Trypanosoma cruzi TaxID=5693 RepID=V5AWQ1_TRYCR|nr:retrotransposon hot spot (RHS) protein [Trypanosoma cruzi Dm28c]PWU86433.1 putative retrotransposon hot spot protein (RHS,) [Trypanosoma cruzi]